MWNSNSVVPLSDGENFKIWGESDPDDLLRIFIDFLEGRPHSKYFQIQDSCDTLDALSWRNSFKALFAALESVQIA